MRREARGLRSAALALALAATGARAWSVEGTAGALDLGGSVRTLPALAQQPHGDPEWGVFDQTLARLTAQARWRDLLVFELHAVEAVTLTSGGAAGSGTLLSGAATRYRALGLRWEQTSGARGAAALELDRLSLKLRLPFADLTVGRQPINFSKSLFWNPLDVFLPFDPRVFDRDYKPGVDAAHLLVPLGESSGVELVGALGRTLAPDAKAGAVAVQGGFAASSSEGAALVARAFTTLGRFDLALQGGKVYGGWMIGAGASGEALGLGLHAEAAALRADPSEKTTLLPDGNGSFRSALLVQSSLSASLGADRRFDNGLVVGLELFHNGGAAPADPLLAAAQEATGQVTNLSRDLGALLLKKKLTPLLSAKLAALLSLSDRSALFAPQLTWSLSDEAELLAGAQLGLGSRPGRDPVFGFPVPRSEFGTAPNLVWVEAKVYF